MSNFINFLNKDKDRRLLMDIFTELGMKDALKIVIDDVKFGIMFTGRDDLSINSRVFLQNNDPKDMTLKMEAYAFSKCLGKGPKIFKPTTEQLLALEKMNLNIETRDFTTPFETMVIELPKDYAESKVMMDFNPKYVLIHNEQGVIIHEILDVRMSSITWFISQPEDSLEKFLTHNDKYEVWDENGNKRDLHIEEDKHSSIKRACLNYCLLLDETGVKRSGPEQPNAYAQLLKHVQRGIKNRHTERNKIELAQQPIIYKPQVEPTNLVRIEEENGVRIFNSEEGSKKKVSTHWRRGHYRMQPHGPANSQRKRIRIPPVMVNKMDLIIGKEYAT